MPLFTLEVLFRVIEKMPILDWSIFRIFLSCNIIALSLSFLMLFIKDKYEKIFNISLLIILTVYIILQTGFKNFLGVYISILTSSQLNAVKDYVKDFIDSFSLWFYTLAIPFLIYLIYKLFLEKKLFKNYYKINIFHPKKLKSSLIAIFTIIILSFIYYKTLSLDFMQNKIQLENTKKLFQNPSNPNISVNQFGITMFGLLDIKTAIFKPNNPEETYYFQKKEETKTDFSRQIDDTAWLKLNETTTNINYKTLNNYFLSRSITPKNEFTGLFKDKNLIVIMMESVNDIFINEKYYPTFTKLYNEGWSFPNSYSPRNSCATGNNEMSGMISLFSIYRTCTANQYKENEYSESIFNLFNNANYNTSSYHNYTEGYYYRSTIHQNMGSSAYYGVQDLEIPFSTKYEEWPSDIDLIKKAFTKIDTNNKFMAWMTSVTSHQPYSAPSEFGDKYLSLFSEENYSLPVKRYMSKLKELDLALEELLKILEEKNILEDTVIVLFGDHYPYGLPNKDLNEVLDYDVNMYNNVEQTPFVIYNKGIEPKTYQAYTTYLNILPTIANLFDLDYDPRLYMGEDILNPNYQNSYKNRIIFADGSWKNDYALYDATNGSITYINYELSNQPNDIYYQNDEIISYNQEINDMIKMSNLAITTNYFKYLNDNLNTYNNNEPKD